MTIKKVCYTYRLRPSAGAERELVSEWGKARAVWSHLVAEGKRRHRQQRRLAAAGINTPVISTIKASLGTSSNSVPGRRKSIGATCVEFRVILIQARHDWHRVPRWHSSRCFHDFFAARQKALMDRKNKTPVTQRRALSRFKSRQESLPSRNYTTRGFSLTEVDGSLRLKLAGGIGQADAAVHRRSAYWAV